MEMIEDKLSIIIAPAIKKRIRRELQMLVEDKTCLENNIKIDIHNKMNEDISISFNNIKDNNNYKFIIGKYYPFKPPKIEINKISINFYHQMTNEAFSKSLKKYCGIDCFCCQTILCSDNWSPKYTFNSIFEDINGYRNARREVVIRIILDVLKRKWLISDIDLAKWLF